jgi:hypothetical protein
METDPPTRPASVDKGKGRVIEPTENTPLLANASSSRLPIDGASSNTLPLHSRRALWTRLLAVFVLSLLFCILLLSLAGLLAWSYASRASKLSPEEILHEGVVLQGPERIDVLNITDTAAISVEASGRVGVNAGSIIGVQRQPYGDPFFQDIWKSFGRWWIRRLGVASVDLSTIHVLTQDGANTLFSIDIPPIEVNLNDDPPRDLSWLSDVTTTAVIHPTSDAGLLLDVLRGSWYKGQIITKLSIASAIIKGGGLHDNSWRAKLSEHITNVNTSVRMKRQFNSAISRNYMLIMF